MCIEEISNDFNTLFVPFFNKNTFFVYLNPFSTAPVKLTGGVILERLSLRDLI